MVATTTTDANGDYIFPNLVAGTYTVTETQPAGFGDGPDTAGSSGGTVGNDIISEIVLGAGEVSINNDFEEIPDPVNPPVDAPILAFTGVESRVIAALALFMVLLGGLQLRLGAATERRTEEQ